MRGRKLPHWTTLACIVILLACVAAFIAISFEVGDYEHEREVRQYGDMECVYNVSLDEIEACSDGSADTNSD